MADAENKEQISLNDLASIRNIISVASRRGAFAAEEFEDVGKIYTKLDNFLKKQTSDNLYSAFLPEVKKAIETVKLTAYWEPLAKKYNQSTVLTGNDPINTDLNDYVTKRAISGIFHLVEQKEKEIRKDPLSRTTELLKKVFGSVDP